MENVNLNKKNGVFYTPSKLADFLVRPLLNKRIKSVFDPSCGKGALFFAALRKLSILKTTAKFYGCDITDCIDKSLTDRVNFIQKNFLDYQPPKKFDLILMNPPYIRYHRISNTKRKQYQKETNQSCQLRLSSDLWAYFLVKSVKHIKKGGGVGAILPWSFLQADYAQCVREWILNRFRSIKVLMLGRSYFDGAKERILLLWLNGYGTQTRSIKIGFSNNIEDQISYSVINRTQWTEKKVVYSKLYDINEIIQKYRLEFGFSELKKWADVRIGVVTGANDFFIMTKKEAYKRGFSSRYLFPILTSAKEFMGLYFNGYTPSKHLFYISNNDLTKKSKKYIEIGENKGFHLRKHSLNRKPWYSVKTGKTPDAFFPYRASYIPYMVFNNLGIQSTNSIHRIYFKDLSESQKLWIQLSLLSAPSQLALEAFSRIYGNGVLKTEPGTLHNTIVYVSEKKISKVVYNKISKLISANKRNNAMQLATDYINKKLGIPPSFTKKVNKLLEELQQRRRC